MRLLRTPLRSPLTVLVALSALLVAACSGGSSSPGGSSGQSGSGGSGGTVTVAYLPGTQPVDIFPLFPAADDTTQEIFWFVEQFWRPLYWFGQDGSLSYNPALSLAQAPKFSNHNKTVSITLKNWKWSDGKPITTADVRFYLNLLTANKTQYANYVPGYIPDNIASVSYPSARTFTINFKQAYSSNWLFLNQLCLLFALPQHAWDKTSASGKIGNYDETAAGARAVFSFLSGQAKDLSTYATNPLWQVVDGPFRISSYQPNSEVTMIPNKGYSGPVRPKVAKVQFLDFTSDAAEYNQLLSGNIDYGYVPFNDVPSEGRLKSQGYSIVPWAQAGMNYAVFNYTNPTTGPLFRQLYIRQAIQHTVDQKTMISSALYGSGVQTYGAVPAYQPAPELNGSPLADPAAQQNAYPYSVSSAVSLLKSHGWSVHPGGTDTCARAGTGASDCGAGIKAGQALSFKFEYPTGVIQDSVEAQLLSGNAAKAGIRITDTPVPTSVTFADSLCTKGAKCTWDSDYYYLGGWQYGVPINYPIGTLIFGCGGPYVGGYCSSQLDGLMRTAEASQQVSALYPYEMYLNKNVPVLWLPLQPYQFSAIKTSLHGATPQNLGYWINPENWTVSG
ncbi:MAG: peptide ABC transporter substrate-binding protein [Streptosporangiaceae bacterium]